MDSTMFMLAPLHIKRKEKIAEEFGVSPETVTVWAREGAPIFLAGNRYQADYHALVEWLGKNRPVCKMTPDQSAACPPM